MNFAQVFLLHLALITIEDILLSDEGGSLDATEVRYLLRSLGLNLTARELEEILKDSPPFEGSFEDLIATLVIVKERLPKVREAARRKIRKDNLSFARETPRKSEQVLEVLGKVNEQAKEIANNIITQCEAGSSWEDPDFPANDQSLFPEDPSRNDGITWARPQKLFPEAALFKRPSSQSDLKQGSLGDCYFLSALTVLASGNGIEELVLGAYPEYGFYQVRFFINNDWVVSTVDDRLPLRRSGKGLLFASGADPSEIWMSILEKAYAKIYGSYGAIENGVTSDALVDLLGETAVNLDTKMDPSLLWNTLLAYDQEGFFMGCSKEGTENNEVVKSQVHANELGIIERHAYAILQVVEALGVKLIRLRNPWGHFEWNGPYSDNSKEWTPKLLDQLNFTFADDGTFFIEFHDFLKQFDQLLAVVVISEHWKFEMLPAAWKGTRTGGCFNYPTWMENPQFLVTCTERANLIATLQHRNERLTTHKYHDHPQSGIFIIEAKTDDNTRIELFETGDKVVGLSDYLNSRQVSTGIPILPNKRYVFFFSTFQPGIEEEFSVAFCWNQGDLHVKELTDSLPKAVVKGEWKGKSAAGCYNYSTWRNAPQYLLHVPQDGWVGIMISQDGVLPCNNYIGTMLFNANSDHTSVVDPDKIIKLSDYKNDSTVSFSTTLEAGYYTVVPSTFLPGQEGKFSLTVSVAAGHATLTEIEKWATTEVQGRWVVPNLAGGCQTRDNNSWPNNPKVSFELDETTLMHFVLEINPESTTQGIGFYLYSSDEHLNLIEKLGKAAFKLDKEVNTSFTLQPGKYVVVPATYVKDVDDSFTLQCFSAKPINLTLHE
eukprot:TRINITY_DN324_c0_g1_i7.p1 TRINITY_DN324_c0_g1~~TRINITY_DN324_c0_g1_i7.p1  ORF type:complete len:831 (+),score=162.05 TRINITY_DN324_c0_g1_i7:479-2971(+)